MHENDVFLCGLKQKAGAYSFLGCLELLMRKINNAFEGAR